MLNALVLFLRNTVLDQNSPVHTNSESRVVTQNEGKPGVLYMIVLLLHMEYIDINGLTYLV